MSSGQIIGLQIRTVRKKKTTENKKSEQNASPTSLFIQVVRFWHSVDELMAIH